MTNDGGTFLKAILWIMLALDHFQQILAWTFKSRWQQQNELLREITGSFRSEK
jgi:hypothetical protein